MSKLHADRSDLWQRPKDSFTDDGVWYCDIPLGKNSLSELMVKISEYGNLSRKYKNHSVRATSITVLDTAGISGRHITKVSGHKSEGSLKSYSHHVSDAKKREISDVFSKALCSDPKKVCDNPTNDDFPDVDIFSDDFELENIDPTISDPYLNNVLKNQAQQATMAVQGTPDISKPVCNVSNPNFFISYSNIYFFLGSK